MLTVNFVTNRPTMGETRTYEDFYKFLGTRPHLLGVVSTMYPDLTASFLTESLANVVTLNKNTDKYRPIDSMYFEWNIDTNYIKRIKFAADVTDTGSNGAEISFTFTERYYEKYDIFKIDGSMQQCIVVSRPVRLSDNNWQVYARLIDNNYSSVLDLNACKAGMTTRFQSVAMPEMHEEGYAKYQSNIEKHRNYLTTFRVDDSQSALYGAHEDVFLKIAEGKGDVMEKEGLYKMTSMEKNLMENFLLVRNQGLLFNKTNVDINGKATIQDPDTGRPLYIGDGIIPQIERFASKYAYNKLTMSVLETAIHMLAQKATSPTGNNFMFVINERMWTQLQGILSDYLWKFKSTLGSYAWSKKANGNLTVGTTYDAYEFAGNTITFKVDRTFTREYGSEKGFGMAIDLTADTVSGKPAMEMFTLKNCQFITNKYPGVGGFSGSESGVVSSPVAASKLINWGIAGVGVYNPWRSFILREI